MVGVSLPSDRAIGVDDNVLILDGLAGCERDSGRPDGVAGGILRGAQRDSFAGVPVPKLVDAADDLDGLAVGSHLPLGEGHGHGSGLRARSR